MYKMIPPLALIAILFFTSCVAKKVAVQARFPAAYPDAAKIQKITVLDFKGTDGRLFTNQLTAELKTANLDGTLIFSVVSEDIVKAGARNLTALLNYGRSLGVQGVYYGEVNPITVKNRNWQEDRYKCLERKSFFKCKRSQTIKVNCYEQSATYTVQPQLVDTRSGTIIYAESVSSTMQNKYCTDTGSQLNQTELTARLRANVAKKIRRSVAPYNDSFSVNIKNDTNGLSPAAEKKFKSGIAFSNAGQMDRACAIWQELSATSPESNQNISLLYNLGVCAEIVAGYDRAIEFYTKADSMLTEPDDVISNARNRALKLKMNQQLI